MAQLGRIKVANPTAKRAKLRRKENPMAAKKRAKHRKKSSNPKKRAAHPKKRHKRANPKRSHARRARRANPKRSHARRAPQARRVRRASANPARRVKRRHKRNPGIPAWAMAIAAAGIGLVAYAVGQAGSFAVTQRVDPSRATLDRNRYIGFGALLVGGVALAFWKPVLGAGLATGGLVGLAGTEVSLTLGKALQQAPEVVPPPAPQKPIAGVFQGGRQRFGAVFQGNRQRFGNMQDAFAG